MKQSISSLKKDSLQGKRIFLRVDFNVPIQNGKISDNTRIKEALPTIKYLIKNEAKIIIGSHLGRPKGKKNDALTLKPIAKELEQELQHPVNFGNDSYSKNIEIVASKLNNGEVLLLENLRFYNEETDNDANLSRFLASLADIYGVKEALELLRTLPLKRLTPAYDVVGMMCAVTSLDFMVSIRYHD